MSDDLINTVKYIALKTACELLLDDVNERYSDKDPFVWKCPHMQKINDLIGYDKREENGN